MKLPRMVRAVMLLVVGVEAIATWMAAMLRLFVKGGDGCSEASLSVILLALFWLIWQHKESR